MIMFGPNFKTRILCIDLDRESLSSVKCTSVSDRHSDTIRKGTTWQWGSMNANLSAEEQQKCQSREQIVAAEDITAISL
jgi:hypothetical protein